jgi:hypothetical protein
MHTNPMDEKQPEDPREETNGQEITPIDDAPVPPLTAPDDTEGG